MACWVQVCSHGGGGGRSSWFQSESLNQSINHRSKGFQTRLDSSWNTSRYIFHAASLKSLSFDINSPSGPQRPWAVHLHTGQAGPVQSSLYSPCPGRFTVQQLCTPKPPDKYRRLGEHRVFSCRGFYEAREKLNGGVSPGTMKGAIRGARNPPKHLQVEGSNQATDFSAPLYCVSLYRGKWWSGPMEAMKGRRVSCGFLCLHNVL